MDPNKGLTLKTLEEYLLRNYRMPQMEIYLRERGTTPEDAAKKKINEVSGAFVGDPQPRTLTSPVTLLRGTDTSLEVAKGKRNPFREWWSPEETLLKFFARFDRIPMPQQLQKTTVQGHLRAGLAVSLGWNELEELWCLQLEAGEQLTGLLERTSEQWVDSRIRNLGRLLGGEEQYFFRIVPPLAVKPYPYRLA